MYDGLRYTRMKSLRGRSSGRMSCMSRRIQRNTWRLGSRLTMHHHRLRRRRHAEAHVSTYERAVIRQEIEPFTRLHTYTVGNPANSRTKCGANLVAIIVVALSCACTRHVVRRHHLMSKQCLRTGSPHSASNQSVHQAPTYVPDQLVNEMRQQPRCNHRRRPLVCMHMTRRASSKFHVEASCQPRIDGSPHK